MSSTVGDPSPDLRKLSSPPGPNLQHGQCIVCGSQLQSQDPATGRLNLFCSDACSTKKLSSLLEGFDLAHDSSPTMSVSGDSIFDICNHCKKRPKYVDGATVHPYCGRTCANLAKGQRPTNVKALAPAVPVRITNPSPRTGPSQPTPAHNAALRNGPGPATRRSNLSTAVHSTNNRNPRIPAHWKNPPPQPPPRQILSRKIQICKTPGCTSPVYIGPNGAASRYCSRSHQQFAEHGCISCRRVRTNGSGVFCQFCYNEVVISAPMIIEVPLDHERYKSVESQFRQKWLHNTECPRVRAIYKIVCAKKVMGRYERYLNQVEARENFASQRKARGNEKRRWHGTTRNCNIGDRGATRFCANSSCSLCCIMRSSFDVWFFSRKTKFGRFGAGIYTSSTSSKSDSYSHNNRKSESKAMILSRVVVGKGFKMTVDNTALTEPPAGYDSVIAEAGCRLNYDELVVYNNDAIRPSYLVMYDAPS